MINFVVAVRTLCSFEWRTRLGIFIAFIPWLAVINTLSVDGTRREASLFSMKFDVVYATSTGLTGFTLNAFNCKLVWIVSFSFASASLGVCLLFSTAWRRASLVQIADKATFSPLLWPSERAMALLFSSSAVTAHFFDYSNRVLDKNILFLTFLLLRPSLPSVLSCSSRFRHTTV